MTSGKASQNVPDAQSDVTDGKPVSVTACGHYGPRVLVGRS